MYICMYIYVYIYHSEPLFSSHMIDHHSHYNIYAFMRVRVNPFVF